jgi:dTDP-N-acetylfucosamine:lipid II N-acetylfucosaminyltransferase
MRRPKILHILFADKFTNPFMPWMDKNFGEKYDQVFLIIDVNNPSELAELLPNGSKKVFLNLPIKNRPFSNLFKIVYYTHISSKIIIHGNPLLEYFGLFSYLLKKTFWVIYGGIDMYLDPINLNSNKNKLKRFVLKRLVGHITHIKGDSDWCNEFYNSRAKHFESPIYLSNIITQFQEGHKALKSDKIGILVGNSFDSSNNHVEIFNWLTPLFGKVRIYCPLSYGSNIEYKEMVIEEGKKRFSNDFIPLVDFMDLVSYKTFLNEKVNVVVFNHKRQEAMGVTLMLLALRKPVFVFPSTSSFHSLKEKGILLFENTSLIYNPNILLEPIEVPDFSNQLKAFYSEDSLYKSWKEIYDFN